MQQSFICKSFLFSVEARPSPGPLQVVGCLNSIHRFERRWFTTFNSEADYETVSNETLESLCEHFEELLESDARLAEADVTLASGVLNVTFPHHGTYVINKQTPNQQIWLSSPFSGPARFDFVSPI
jgi:frataxin